MEKQVVEMTPQEFTKMINEKDTKEEFMIAVDLSDFAEKKYPLSDGKEKKKISFSQGTGFLTNDGRFVTARHCVEPWMFDVKELQAAYALANSSEGLLKIYSTIVAINMQVRYLSAKAF